MTRKDYLLVASAVAHANIPEETLEVLISNLVRGFREDNDRFDAVRFGDACRDSLHSKR